MNDGVAGLGLLYWVTRLSKGAFMKNMTATGSQFSWPLGMGVILNDKYLD